MTIKKSKGGEDCLLIIASKREFSLKPERKKVFIQFGIVL